MLVSVIAGEGDWVSKLICVEDVIEQLGLNNLYAFTYKFVKYRYIIFLYGALPFTLSDISLNIVCYTIKNQFHFKRIFYGRLR